MFAHNHIDYTRIPLSAQHTDTINIAHQKAVQAYRAALKTSDAQNEYFHLAFASVEKAAREGDVVVLNEFLPALPFHDGLWRDLQHTVARDHFDAFCCIVQHMQGKKDLIKGLEAAAYFGKRDFIDAIVPYCQELDDPVAMKRAVSAALEGKQYTTAQQLMPLAYKGRGLMGELLTALLNKKFDDAELWYPYSSVKLVRKHILLQPQHDQDVVAALEWLENRCNHELAAKIQKTLKTKNTPSKVRKL